MVKKIEITYNKIFNRHRYHLATYGNSKKGTEHQEKMTKIMGYDAKIIETNGYPIFGKGKYQKQYVLYVSDRRVEEW